MAVDRCPSCGRIFTVGEVTGLGILRSRQARMGGPIMEFDCPGCGRRMRFIPHGRGRYARPGEPPPPPVPEAQRVPPWVEIPPTGAAEPAAAPASNTPPVREKPEPHPPSPPPQPSPRPAGKEEPMTVPRALEILDLSPTSRHEDIEQAYREKSRTCHPDKVAHLDSDFQTLAEQKFKRLRQAYEILTSESGRT